MRRLGTTTRVRKCDACGKSDLARTVVFADGAKKVHLGSECARKRKETRGPAPALSTAPMVVPADFRMTQAEYDATHVLDGMAYRLRDKFVSDETKILEGQYARSMQIQDPDGIKRNGKALTASQRYDEYRAVMGLRVGADSAVTLSKSPAEMQPAEINRALDRVAKERSKIVDEFIAAGRGHETPSETYRKTDSLAQRANANSRLHDELHNEIERRMGPGATSRLPRGFGPIRKDFAVSRPPGITVASTGAVKRNGRLLGFAHSKYGTMPSGKFGKIGESSTTSRTDGRSIHKLHATREDAIAYVIAHGWAYGDPPKETDERG